MGEKDATEKEEGSLRHSENTENNIQGAIKR